MVCERIPECIKAKNRGLAMKAKEFWHESLTEESWKKLQDTSKETELTVIGGWGVWLWTKQHKSKDIDIIIDFQELANLKEKYSLEKNDRLKKIEGINTISCEALLILKQGAEIDRRGTIKGQKDAIDLLTILFYAPIDFKKYFALLEKNKKQAFAKELAGAITSFNPKDSEKYLGTNYKEFVKKKKQLLEKIK